MSTGLKKAIEANLRQRRRLLAGSMKDQSGLGDGLAPFGGIPIYVYLTEPRLVRDVSLNPNAIATVMRDSFDDYHQALGWIEPMKE